MKTIDIMEKDVLVDVRSNWEPHADMMMHIATINDWGASLDERQENSDAIVADGGVPVIMRLRITIAAEEVIVP